MAKLKAELSADDFEGLDKGLKAAYTQKGDRWVLDVDTESLRPLFRKELEKKDTRINELEEQNQGLKKDVDHYAVENVIRNAAIDAGARKKALNAIVRAAREDGWQRGEGDKPVLMRDGKPVYGKVPNQQKSIEEWMGVFLAENDFYIEDSGESGAGNTGAGARPSGKKPSEMSQGEKSDYISKNGLDAWEALIETA